MTKLKIDKNLKKPVYQQICDWVYLGINSKNFIPGYHLPSINQIAEENSLARETVVKAFRILREKGIVQSVHGKGFFIVSEKTNFSHHVFLLLDTLSAYKEVMFEAIQKTFGNDAVIDIYFHHFNPKTFKNLINEAAGNYTSYLVLPFDNKQITEMLQPVPEEKLYLLDRWPRFYKNPFVGVYQDFYNDVINALSSVVEKVALYKKVVLIFRDALTDVPTELLEGFEAFCYENRIDYEAIRNSFTKDKIKRNVAYLTIDDNDLVKVLEVSLAKKWKIGKDIGIISYNDTPLKKVVANGISVISTNFEKMGKKVAKMVLSGERNCMANAGNFIDRGSL